MSRDVRIAHFISDRDAVEAATAYGANAIKVPAIAERDRCPRCGGTIKITTVPDEDGATHDATFTRLHPACFQVCVRLLC